MRILPGFQNSNHVITGILLDNEFRPEYNPFYGNGTHAQGKRGAANPAAHYLSDTMNHNAILNCLGVILFGCIMSCTADRQYRSGAPLPPTKYKIDGSFDDWKKYETAKTDTGIDWSKVTIIGYEGIHLKKIHYDTDDTYFYLFFKFKPTIQERYDKNHSTGALGYLYIDTDANTNTGCSSSDADGRTIPGAEIQIYFPIGCYVNEGTSGCYVACEIKRWDTAIKSFGQTVRTEDTRDDVPLIAHGKDGVEVAIPLVDLRLAKGSEFAFAFWEDLVPREYVNRIILRLK